jgi:hypothetical protein
MNHKLALQEFTAFKGEVQRMTYSYPIKDTQIDSAYDKCQNMLDSLFKLEVNSFRSQLAGIKVKNVGASSPDKATRLINFIDNIIDDIKVREKTGTTSYLEDIAVSKQYVNTIKEYKKNLNDVIEINTTLGGQFDQLKGQYDELEKLYDASEVENTTLEREKSKSYRWLFILGLSAFTYTNLTYHFVLGTPFNLKLFVLIESAFFAALLFYHIRRIPKWVISILLLLVAGGLLIYLLKQPGWEIQLSSALWTLLISLIAAYIGYRFKWNK